MASASRISGDHEDVGLTNLCEKSEDEKEEDSTDGSETFPVTNGKILNKEKSNSSTSVNFEKFVTLCLPHMRIPGDEPIVEKLKKHFYNMDVTFRNSQECHHLIEKYMSQLSGNNVQIYVIIQEVIYSFKSNKLLPDPHQRHIKKLENLLEQLDKKIKKLQAKEVDFDDEENSNYILECRLKEKFSKVYSKLCDIVGCSKHERRAKIAYNGTRYPEINTNIARYLRKYPDEFPDYNTVITIVEETNREAGLHLTDDVIACMAREIFEEIGSQLKKRRIEEFSLTIGCHLTDDVDDNTDPAVQCPELREKLESNQVLGNRRINEILEKYAAQQESAVNEEESSSDSEDDDSVEGDVDGSSTSELSASEDDSKIQPCLNSHSSTSLPSKNGKNLDAKLAVGVGTIPVKSENNSRASFISENSSKIKKRERSSSVEETSDLGALPSKKKPILKMYDEDDVIVLSD